MKHKNRRWMAPFIIAGVAGYFAVTYSAFRHIIDVPSIHLWQLPLCLAVATAVGIEIGYLFVALSTIAGAGVVLGLAKKAAAIWVGGEIVAAWILIMLCARFSKRDHKALLAAAMETDKAQRALAELHRETASYKARIAHVEAQTELRRRLAQGVAMIGRSLNPAEIQQGLKEAVKLNYSGMDVEVAWFHPSSEAGMDPFELWMRDHNRFLLVTDTRKDERFRAYFERGFLYDYRSLAMVPIKEHASGGRTGVLKLQSRQPGALSQEDVRVLDLYALLVNLGLENASLVQKIEELAVKDTLTGVYTRKVFDERLLQECAQASRYNLSLTMALVDIDHFKSVNDRYGHQAGDQLLVLISGLLKTLVRDVDFVARYGGEEFVVLFPETGKEQAAQTMDMIRQKVEAQEFRPNGSSVLKATISVGVAGFPEETTSPHQLLRAADERLYMAKGVGRNRVVSY
ncbi:MAG: sensor domain-containing diguanylate cyclase [Elusimicrobia bacterium]|nr:sensor domain-containing diguanylate cyclase [Elusimicrobiota bacterium]